MRKEKPLKNLDRNELIIKWGDLLILNSNHLGEVSRDSFMFDWVFDRLPPTPEDITRVENDPARKIRDEFFRRLNAPPRQLDLFNKEIERNLTAVKNHLLSHAYIENPNFTETFWRISETGKLMKEQGGHKKYIANKKREAAALRSDQNAKIYWWVRDIIKVLLGLAIGYCLRYLIEPPNKKSEKQPTQQTTQKATVSTKQADKDTILPSAKTTNK